MRINCASWMVPLACNSSLLIEVTAAADAAEAYSILSCGIVVFCCVCVALKAHEYSCGRSESASK
jgi:hypothetical protein